MSIKSLLRIVGILPHAENIASVMAVTSTLRTRRKFGHLSSHPFVNVIVIMWRDATRMVRE